MEEEQGFFDFAAEVGLTKHLGGLGATEKLIALCHISEGSHVLDVGCGVGVTPSFLVKTCGCRVVGVDISEKMIERSKETALREGIADRTEFRTADAQDLPYEDNLFDAVITESVTAFPEDKQKAVNEYVRVTKPGGYVGLNESTWLKTPPPPEMEAWVSQDMGAHVKPQTPAEWVRLMEVAGLDNVNTEVFEIQAQQEGKEIVRRYGWGGMIRVMTRILALYARDPAYRSFVKGVQKQGLTPENLDEYFGYGLYVGRK